MKVFLAFPVLPPAFDGIGDYTARLAEAMRGHCEVGVLTGPDADLEGVKTWGKVLPAAPDRLDRFERVLEQERPDWLVLQYNPFSYGRWGFNPWLPVALRRIRRRLPGMRLAIMVHEPFMPFENVRWALMSLWQRWQFWMLGRAADAVFLSIAPWADRFRSWFPEIPVQHLPVGCNIPDVGADRAEVRRAYGFSDDDLVVGFFGSGRPARLLPFVRASVEALGRGGLTPTVLYVGSDSERVGEALRGLPVVEAGALPPAEVSRAFAAMDLYLAPFRKGVSSRRGSFMGGLQHGLATVTTVGTQTDPFLRAAAPGAFRTAPDDDRAAYVREVWALAGDEAARSRVAAAGREFFSRHFAWSLIAESMLDTLRSVEAQPPRTERPAADS